MHKSNLGRVITGTTIIVAIVIGILLLICHIYNGVHICDIRSANACPTPVPTIFPPIDPPEPTTNELSSTFQNPVIADAEGDPHVISYNGIYYCFASNSIHTSTDLTHWKKEDLEVLAPSTAGMVAQLNGGQMLGGECFIYKNNFYFLYFYRVSNATTTKDDDWHYLGIAMSNSSITGPYYDVQAPLFTNFTQRAGEACRIGDPCIFIDRSQIDSNYPDGKPYIFFNTWDFHESPYYKIWGALLPDNLVIPNGIISPMPTLLLYQTLPYENLDSRGYQVMEGTEVFKRGSIYYLTYTSNPYSSEYYCISAATSTNPLGTYTKYGAPFLYENPAERVYGPGHGTFAYSNDGSQLYVVYSGRSEPNVERKASTRIDKVNFDTSTFPARMYIPGGPTSRLVLNPPSTHGTANDYFDKTELNRGIWKILCENPLKWSLTANPGYLTINTENYTLYNEKNIFRNAFVQDAPPGDFLVQIRVDMKALNDYEQAGLLIYKDMDNYYKLSHGFWGIEAINVDKEIDGVQTSVYKTNSYPYPGSSEISFQAVVLDDEVYPFYAEQGVNYVAMPKTKIPFEVRKIGLIATRDSSPVEREAKFDFVRFLHDRVRPGYDRSSASNMTMDHPPAFINDKRDSTYWETLKSPGGDAWTGVDLGWGQYIYTICIKWGNDYSDHIGVCVGDSLTDPTTWRSVADVSGITGGNTVIQLPTVQYGQCVIIYMCPNTSHPNDKYSIKTIRVYGGDDIYGGGPFPILPD